MDFQYRTFKTCGRAISFCVSVPVSASAPCRCAAMLCVLLGSLRPSHAPSRACPPAASLVLSDEGDWLAASKPAGITVHEGSDSLLAALRADGYGELLPVHRLDRATSGVLLLAKRPEKAAALQAALAETAVKQYRGVLVGVPPARRGRWAGALSNRAEGRRNPRGVAAERARRSREQQSRERAARAEPSPSLPEPPRAFPEPSPSLPRAVPGPSQPSRR